MSEKPTHYIIDQALAQAVLNYLQQKPFAEVHQLIGALVRLQPAPEQPAATNGASAEPVAEAAPQN